MYIYYRINKNDKADKKINRDFSTVTEELKRKEEKELENIKSKDGLTTRKAADLYNLLEGLKSKQKDLDLQEHKLKLEDDMTKSHVAKLNEVEEQLESDYEKMEKISKYENSLKLAIEMLQKSYNQLKEEVIPQIAENIKVAIAETTNGEYVNVKYNDNEGMLVENSIGELVKIEKLSIGTIDQMYFGFRKAILKNMTDIPIIMDETFAYYDDARLENIIKTIEKMSQKNQIIMMSCSRREKEMLDKLNIKYNLIEM